MAENVVELVHRNRKGHVFSADRRDCKPLVMSQHKARQKGVTSVHVRDVRKSEFLDEAVLKRAVHAFDAALGLAGVGAMISMFSSAKARPNWVMPVPPGAFALLIRKTVCL